MSAIGATAGIAGCSGDDGDATDTDTDTGNGTGNGNDTETGNGNDEQTETEIDEQNFEDRYFTGFIGTPPQDVNYQFWRTNADWYIRSLVNTWGAASTLHEPQVQVPVLFQDWGMRDDGVTFYMDLNEDFYWHDGKNVTAEDIVQDYEMQYFMQSGQGADWLDMVEGARDVPGGYEDALPEAVDEYTVEMELAEEQNPDIVAASILSEPYVVAPQQYQPVLEDFRDATTTDEIEDIRVRVGEELSFDTDLGFGPVKKVDQNDRFIYLDFYEDYPWETVQNQLVEAIGPDNVGTDVRGWGAPNFKGIELKYLDGDSARRQEIMSDSLDGGPGPYIPEEELPPGRLNPTLSRGYGQGMMFNLWDWGPTPGDKHLNPRRFDGANDIRKGLAHSIDRELAGQQLGGGPDVPIDEIFTGMLSAAEAKWLDDDFMNQLDAYEHDTDMVAEYFEQAGFEMQDDVWHTPEGEPWQPVIADGAGVTRYVNMWEVASSNMERAGVDVQTEFQENATFYPKENNERGYDFSTGAYGGPNGAHPHFEQNHTWTNESVEYENTGIRDTFIPGNPGEDEEETIEVPPIGDWDTDERNEIDPKALIGELRTATDQDRIQEVVEQLSWAANWWVPKITMHEHQQSYHMSENGWTMPDPNEAPEMSFNPGFNMPFHWGIVRAREE